MQVGLNETWWLQLCENVKNDTGVTWYVIAFVKFSHNLMTRGPWDRTQFLWESAMGKLTFHSWQILYSLKYCSKLGAWSKFTMGRKFMLLAALPKNMRLNSLNRKGPVASKCWGSWQALESSRAGGSQVPRKSQPGLFARVRWMIQCVTFLL